MRTAKRYWVESARASACRCSAAVCLALLAACAALGQGARREAAGVWAARSEEIVRVVRTNLYDSQAADAWADRHARYGADARSAGEFAALTRRAITELGVSHTGYYTAADPEFYALLAIYGTGLKAGDGTVEGIGADISPDGFVHTVFAQGPAATAGVRRGDRIVAADGKPLDRVGSFRGKAGSVVRLSVQRSGGQPPLVIAVHPRRLPPKREWLEALEKGARLVERGGKRIAYVPMFACAGEEFENALKDQLSGRLARADALVLDLRGGWGGCNPDFVNLFNPAPAVLTYTGRDKTAHLLDSQWRKPLFVLIDGGSRSGKEVVAYSVKKHHLGTLVGRRTACAVMAGRCFRLSDGALLLLAVADVRVDGEKLEGRGVEPDVLVEDALPFANGADPQLERAIELATTGRR